MRLERLPTFRRDINRARRGWALKPSKVASSRQEVCSEGAGKMVFTLGPVEALARDAMATRCDPVNIQSQMTEPFDTARRDNEGLSVSQREVAVAEHRLGNSDAQAPGEMIVAAAREAKTLHRSIGCSATHGLAGAEGGQMLEQGNHPWAGQPIVTVTAFPLYAQQSASQELSQMGTRGLGRYPRTTSQLSGWVGTPVHQHNQHGGACRIGNEGGGARDSRLRVHGGGSLRATIIAQRSDACFDVNRNIRCLLVATLARLARATPDGDQIDLVEVMDLSDGLIAHHRVYWGWIGFRTLSNLPAGTK
jgi:hypothetical protein